MSRMACKSCGKLVYETEPGAHTETSELGEDYCDDCERSEIRRRALAEMDQVVRLSRAYASMGELPAPYDPEAVKRWRLALVLSTIGESEEQKA